MLGLLLVLYLLSSSVPSRQVSVTHSFRPGNHGSEWLSELPRFTQTGTGREVKAGQTNCRAHLLPYIVLHGFKITGIKVHGVVVHVGNPALKKRDWPNSKCEASLGYMSLKDSEI